MTVQRSSPPFELRLFNRVLIGAQSTTKPLVGCLQLLTVPMALYPMQTKIRRPGKLPPELSGRKKEEMPIFTSFCKD